MRTSVVLVLVWSTAAMAQHAPAPPSTSSVPAPPTSSAAPGASAVGLAPIVVDETPEPCRELAKLAGSTSKNAALSARISLATCIADQQTKALVLCDCEQSVLDVNAAIDPSLAMLDEVYTHGDTTLKILARHAQGQLLASFSSRMLATVPAPATSHPDAIALRDTRLMMLRPLIDPWQVRAQGAFAEVDKLARTNPQLAKNTAVVAAVRSSREKLAQVAKR